MGHLLRSCVLLMWCCACGAGSPDPDPAPSPVGAPLGLPAGDLVAPATVALGGAGLSAPAGSGLAIATLEWDWGDGSAADATAADGTATHEYDAQGRYTLTVTARYDDGRSAAVSFGIVVVQDCARIVTFEDGKTPGREVHVALDGDDGTGDGSAGAPYRTLGRAAGDAAPGVAIRLHAGTWPGGTFLTGLAGTAAAPIWIGGAPGEARPVIEGGGEGLHLVRVRWLVLHDLEVAGAANNGINCDDGGDYADPEATRHVVFRDLFIHDVGTGGNQDGLKLSGVDDYVVLDCVIARTSASGIDHVGCHAGLIARCRFENTGANAIQCKGGTADVEIRWCTLVEPGPRGVNIGGSTGFEFFRPPLSTTAPNAEARNVRVVGNVIAGGDAAFAFVGAVDCVAAHNTILAPHTWLFRILQETTSQGGYVFEETRDCEVTNNLFRFERADLSTWVNIGANTRPETFRYRNNLWFAWDDPAQSQPAQVSGETGGIYGADPLLANPAALDVTPAAGSPARGAGAAQTWLGAGIGGGCMADPPTIGARE